MLTHRLTGVERGHLQRHRQGGGVLRLQAWVARAVAHGVPLQCREPPAVRGQRAHRVGPGGDRLEPGARGIPPVAGVLDRSLCADWLARTVHVRLADVGGGLLAILCAV